MSDSDLLVLGSIQKPEEDIWDINFKGEYRLSIYNLRLLKVQTGGIRSHAKILTLFLGPGIEAVLKESNHNFLPLLNTTEDVLRQNNVYMSQMDVSGLGF